MKSRTTLAVAAAFALASLSAPALAQSAGDWTLGIGAHQVAPKSNNGTLAGGLALDVDDDIRPTITAEYFLTDNLGIEVLAALPFEHDIDVKGLGKVGSTKHLPPVVSLQYHFGQGKVRPFVGAGVNFTKFFEEETSGALEGSKLELDSSWGVAGHVGVDFAVSERSSIRVDARWIDIESDVKLDGVKLGSAEIDPMVYGAAWILRF